MTLIDVNVWIDYPLAAYEADAGDAMQRLHALAAAGVTECWAGSFASLFALDPDGSNEALIRACAHVDRLRVRPAPTVNPTLPDAERQFVRLARAGVRVVRVYPPAHGYTLTDSAFQQCVRLAATHRMVVQVVCSIEDPRTQPPSVRWPVLQPAVPREWLEQLAGPVVFLNCAARRHTRLFGHSELLYVDTAMQEGAGVLDILVQTPGASHLLFGSYTPVFYTASNLLKLSEAELTREQLHAICCGNARRLVQEM